MNSPILSKNQILFLKKLAEENFFKRNFYLTGGTALAAFYLQHRYSEDLDFFSEREIDLLSINTFLKKIKNEMRIRKIDFQKSYNRNLYFLHFNNEILKVEFTFFPFPRIEKGMQKDGLIIDSQTDIAVNKLFTLYQRTQARDYIDFYSLCKKEKFEIDYLIKLAKAKFDWHIDPLQLGMQFVKATDAKDMPRMIKKMAPSVWQNFFLAEAKKLKKDIVY